MMKEKKFNLCLHAVEQVLYTKNNNVVTPFALERNIIMYSISRSKLSTTIFGSWEWSGGYIKVNNILNSPADPLKIPDQGDIIVTFDNEQKVGKNLGRIREESKQASFNHYNCCRYTSQSYFKLSVIAV